MKRIASLLLVLLLCCGMALPSMASDVVLTPENLSDYFTTTLPEYGEQGSPPAEHAGLVDHRVEPDDWTGIPIVDRTFHVQDFADALTPEQQEEMEIRTAHLVEQYGIDILILQSANTNGMDADDFAEAFYTANSYGKGAKRDGILFFVDYSVEQLGIRTFGSASEFDEALDLKGDELVEIYNADILDAYGACASFVTGLENIFANRDIFSTEISPDEMNSSNVGRFFNTEMPIRENLGNPPNELAGISDTRVMKGNWKDIPIVDNTYKVHDFAGSLTEAQRKALEAEARSLTEAHNIDVVVTITANTLGRDYADFAMDFYEANAFGLNQNTDGIIFVLDYENRKFDVLTHGKGEDLFSYDDLNKILDEIAWKLQADILDSNGATEAYFAGVQQRFDDIETMKVFGTLVFAVLGLIIAAIVVIILLVIHKKSLPGAITAQQYIPSGQVQMLRQNDQFIRTFTTRTRRASESSGGGGGGGGRTSSSGSSFGSGGGRSF